MARRRITSASSVAISSGTVVVGAPGGSAGAIFGPGAAYVFVKPAAGWATMTQTAKLTASNAAGSEFGNSVSIDGDTIVVGAHYATVGANDYQGAAYVFAKPGSAWTDMTQTATLTASDGAMNARFGSSVSISGNTVVVGAALAQVGSGPLFQGAAYVFAKGAAWTDMTQTAKLTASDGASDSAGAEFGSSVSISGNTLVVGAPHATVGPNLTQGAAYVFTQPGGGWADATETAKLTESDGAKGDLFGSSVSISGNTVVVGEANAAVGPNLTQGVAYVFIEPASGWANMTQTVKLSATRGAAGDGFGLAVAIDGDTLVVGAPDATAVPFLYGFNPGRGAAYVFVRTQAGPVVTGIYLSSGPAAGGRMVTITGTGFTAATAVDFGPGAATSVVVDSDTQIRAASPAGSGTVNVKVVAPAGTSTPSAADQFTYYTAAPVDKLGIYSNADWYVDASGDKQIANDFLCATSYAGDVPVVGDWNGDGKTEIGLFNPATATWWLDTNENGTLDSGDAQYVFGFPGSNVIPVVGDWNGDGKTEVGIYVNGVWFRDVDGSHTWDAANQATIAYLGWDDGGTHTVIPVPGHWAGTGKTQIGVYCNGAWFLDSAGTDQWDGGHTYWGWSGALIPIAGNWSGSGTKDQLAVYDQGVWFQDYDNTHAWDAANQAAVAYYGWSGAVPVVGQWATGKLAAASAAAPTALPAQSQPAVSSRAVDRIALLTAAKHESGNMAGLDDLNRAISLAPTNGPWPGPGGRLKHTVIPHRTELLSLDDARKVLRLKCTLDDGVTVQHTITARDDEVDFRLTAHNPGSKRSEAHSAQACPRLGPFTGYDPPSANLDDYLPKCFIFLDGRLTRLPTPRWATEAHYTPGQVWCPRNVPRTNVNPRPLSPLVPSNGLIGCFSADDKLIFATAWEPYQELFQGVIRCLHADFRLGGLQPGETKQVRGKIYIVPANVPALLRRYQRDFPEHNLVGERRPQASRSNYQRPCEPPVETAFQPLPPGAVEPALWLRDWAVAMREGISGHLDEQHPVFADGWKGTLSAALGTRGARLRVGPGGRATLTLRPFEVCLYEADWQ